MSSNEGVLNVEEAAAFIGLKPITLYRGISSKAGLTADLPYLRLGRRIVYRRADLEAWLEKHLVNPAETAPTRKPPKAEPAAARP